METLDLRTDIGTMEVDLGERTTSRWLLVVFGIVIAGLIAVGTWLVVSNLGQSDVETTLQELHQDYAALDAEGVASHFHPAGKVVMEPSVGITYEGHDQIQAWISEYPEDSVLTWGAISVAADTYASVPYRWELREGGTTVVNEGISVFRMVGERVMRQYIYNIGVSP